MSYDCLLNRDRVPRPRWRGRALLLSSLVTVAFLSGCAAWHSALNPSPSVADQRVQRESAAIREFEQYRNAAQLEAALDRWRMNDIAGCETRLRTLIERRPDFVPARLHLAELAWSFDDAAEAEQQYRTALQLAPDRPDIQHALGLVLEATGRTDEARAHFAKASELAPEDEVFRLAATSSPASAESPASRSGRP